MGCCSNGSNHHDHHGHHHHHDSCGCCDDSCTCPCHEEVCAEEEECCSAESLLAIADCAWAEVLKEKIKDHIRSNDKKIDQLAKIVAEANHKRWKHKMQKDLCCSEYEECCEDFEEQLCMLFSSCDANKSEPKKK